MGHQLDVQRLELAFQGRPDIIGAIQKAAAAPNWIELFNEISLFVSTLQNTVSEEPASKKRKIEHELSINSIPNGSGISHRGVPLARDDDEPALLHIKDVSLVIPQRKKFALEFTSSYIRARHPQTNDLIPGISYAWKDITYAFCLPVPEKAQKQYNYAIFPKQSYLPSTGNGPVLDPLVFTISSAPPKPGIISGSDTVAASTVSDDYKTLFGWAISRYLKAADSLVPITEADAKQFTSVIKEAYRPNEKALFTKGFRGSKDGYLFFLNTGIFWGFKKPLHFLPKERIAAVSYTSVLQRTFNLNVEIYTLDCKLKKGADDNEEEVEELEFAMLDQEDFEGIDTYVKRHGLQDASMAEQRRAKRLGINVVKNEDGKKVDVGDPSELQKAELALQDEEDEEEEDYHPGSEGESEGEGTSSEEGEDGDSDEGEEADYDEGGSEEEREEQ